jgi:acetolactate synthase small subunit
VKTRVRNSRGYVSRSMGWLDKLGAKCQTITQKSGDHKHHSSITSKILASRQVREQKTCNNGPTKDCIFIIRARLLQT